jgi:hypothetical protein
MSGTGCKEPSAAGSFLVAQFDSGQKPHEAFVRAPNTGCEALGRGFVTSRENNVRFGVMAVFYPWREAFC